MNSFNAENIAFGLQEALKGKGIITLTKHIREVYGRGLAESKRTAEDILVTLGEGIRNQNGYYKPKWRTAYLQDGKVFHNQPNGHCSEVMVENV